jgi:hypothetical protein
MLSDDRSQISFERYGYAGAAMNTDKTAAVGIEKVHFGMSTSPINPVYLEAG